MTGDKLNVRPGRPLRWLVVLAIAAAWPIANFLHNNWSMLVASDLSRAAWWWLGLFVVATLIALVASWVVKRLPFGSIVLAISVGIVLFFVFEWAVPTVGSALGSIGLPRRMANFVYLAAALAVVVGVLLITRSTALQRIVATFVVVGGAASIGSLAADYARTGWHDPDRHPARALMADARSPDQRPNVFLIVLDGYSRADILEKVTGFNNAAILATLRDRGFTIVDKATANYPVTYLSVSSLLATDYLAVPEQPFKTRGAFYDAIQGNNAWVASFKAMGYRYVHSGNVWGGSSCSGREDYCLNSRENLPARELDLSLIQMTPFRLFLPNFVTTTDRGNLEFIISGLDAIYEHPPFFFFAHTMPPHPPFDRGPDCKKRRRLPSLEWWSSPEEYRDATRCVNQQFTTLVDKVIARDPGAVIVLLSDHGSGFTKPLEADLDRWTDEMITERFPSFLAMRVPDSCRERPPASLSNVNVGRFVVACIAGTRPEYRSDRFFTGVHERHPSFGQVYEVTTRVQALNLR